MMRTASEKLAIIRLVEDSELSVRRTLDEIKIRRTMIVDVALDRPGHQPTVHSDASSK